MNKVRILPLELLVLAAIIGIAFFVRLYKIDNPVADWHSWRQADTAAVARDFFQNGFNPLFPRYDDMSDVSGKGFNPNRFRFVEFPIYPSVVYAAYLLNGSVDETLARLVSVLFSLGSIVFLFLIVKKYFSAATALLSALIFGLLPYNVFYSRVILPEPSLVFFCLGMFYFVARFIQEEKIWLLGLGAFFTALALLTKPMAAFYLLPLGYVYYQKNGRIRPVRLRFVLFLILSFLPFILWRYWIAQHPEGIPQSAWLLNGNGIRLRPAFWRWIVGDRFGREILSAAGTSLFVLGLILKPKPKEDWTLHLLALSLLSYLVVFATGNVQHDYYQVLIVPALCVFVARGFVSLFAGVREFVPRLVGIPVALLLLGLTFYLTWVEVKGLYQINNWAIVEAGKEASRMLPEDAVVVAPFGGDTAFLYQLNRPGFAFIPTSIDDLVDRFGVTHFVSINYDDDTNKAMKEYKVLKKTPEFVIIDVRKAFE